MQTFEPESLSYRKVDYWSKRLPRSAARQIVEKEPKVVVCRPKRPFNRNIHAKLVRKRLFHIIHKVSKHVADMRLSRRVFTPCDLIIDQVCAALCLPKRAILSDQRNTHVVYARQLCMYLMCKHSSLSLPQIGKKLYRDHSTVMYGRDKVSANIEEYQKVINTVEAKLGYSQ